MPSNEMLKRIDELESIKADLLAALQKLHNTAETHWPRRTINRDTWAYNAAMAQASTAIARAKEAKR